MDPATTRGVDDLEDLEVSASFTTTAEMLMRKGINSPSFQPSCIIPVNKIMETYINL